jgi:2-iminobutanoate/2-iminopropanoate deaminase
MSKYLIQTKKAPPPGGDYSQGIRVDNLIFTSGQGPWDPITREVVGESIEDQTKQTLENIRSILEASGASLANVVKINVYLSDMDLFSRFNQVYSQYFSVPKPVRTTVGSLLSGILVEIDAVAYLENY